MRHCMILTPAVSLTYGIRVSFVVVHIWLNWFSRGQQTKYMWVWICCFTLADSTLTSGNVSQTQLFLSGNSKNNLLCKSERYSFRSHCVLYILIPGIPWYMDMIWYIWHDMDMIWYMEENPPVGALSNKNCYRKVFHCEQNIQYSKTIKTHIFGPWCSNP